MNNPIRFIDPDGMGVLDVYVSKEGKYLGEDGASSKEVRVVDEGKFNEVKEKNGGTTNEGATQELQAEGTKLTEYGEGINMTNETWGKVEAAGGERVDPTVVNNSDQTIYYKPEGKKDGVNLNPGKDTQDAYPIAPGQQLYAPVDGVKTPTTAADKVYRIPDNPVSSAFTTVVDKKGNPDIKRVPESIIPKYGEVRPPDPGWHKLRDAYKKK